jgi:hypothetical protein
LIGAERDHISKQQHHHVTEIACSEISCGISLFTIDKIFQDLELLKGLLIFEQFI